MGPAHLSIAFDRYAGFFRREKGGFTLFALLSFAGLHNEGGADGDDHQEHQHHADGALEEGGEHSRNAAVVQDQALLQGLLCDVAQDHAQNDGHNIELIEL